MLWHSVLSYSSSSFVVLGRSSDGTSETPAAGFLRSSVFHPGKPLRSPNEDDDDDEDEDDGETTPVAQRKAGA
jgi:hypothetical protein